MKRMPNKATDIVKQIQEALEFYASDSALDHVDDEIKLECKSGEGFSNFGELAKESLKLIPSLLAELERAEKGVSLVEMTEAAITYRALCACYRLNKRPSEKLFSRLEKAKAVLDKVEVPYHD